VGAALLTAPLGEKPKAGGAGAGPRGGSRTTLTSNTGLHRLRDRCGNTNEMSAKCKHNASVHTPVIAVLPGLGAALFSVSMWHAKHVPYTHIHTHKYLSVSPDRGSRMSRRNDRQTAVPRRPTIMLRTCSHESIRTCARTRHRDRARAREIHHTHTQTHSTACRSVYVFAFALARRV
jgi:hypothetical protein